MSSPRLATPPIEAQTPRRRQHALQEPILPQHPRHGDETTPPRLALSYYLDSTSYSPTEYATDVYNNVFEKTIAGNESLTPEEMQFQNLYVRYLLSNISNLTNSNAAKVGLTGKSFLPLSDTEVQHLLNGETTDPLHASAPAGNGMLCGHDHGQDAHQLNGAPAPANMPSALSASPTASPATSGPT